MNKEKYTLQEVTTPALEREWLDFPKRIYKGNRNWVCPLDVDVLEVFNPSKNELFADGEAIRWVARDARGELVGRIAAFYNREKASIEEQPTGGCGFFESIDDQQMSSEGGQIVDDPYEKTPSQIDRSVEPALMANTPELSVPAVWSSTLPNGQIFWRVKKCIY